MFLQENIEKNRIAFDENQKVVKIKNSWRSIRETARGKKIGNSIEWDKFENFLRDVKESYFDNARLIRKDKNDNFNKDNCIWVHVSQVQIYNQNSSKLEYNNTIKSLKEWSIELDLNYNGLRKRFYSEKYTSPEQILFGKRKLIKNKGRVRTKNSIVSGLLSQYKCKDSKRGFENNLSTEWFIENIFDKPCTYCGDTKSLIGADRVDNSKGHTTDNIVPCCKVCNIAKSDFFTAHEMKRIGKIISEIKQERANGTGY